MLRFIINNQKIKTNIAPGTILLDFIRQELKFTGTKEACRAGECGSCTVLVGAVDVKKYLVYKSSASCILPIGGVKNCHIVTIEGLNFTSRLNTVQQCVVDNNAVQCGFCTPGIILSLTSFCLTSPNFSYNDAINALDGNLCRCTGYVSIRNAAKALANILRGKNSKMENRISVLVDSLILPEYFLTIAKSLKSISLKSELHNRLSKDSITVAGGTDLFVQQPARLHSSKFFFISDRKDLKYIKRSKDHIFVGSAVTVEQFRHSDIINKYFPTMNNDLLSHSSMILRNRATLAGNIVNASPIGDMIIILLALNAVLAIECKEKDIREISLAKFYTGYKKFNLEQCEIIKEIKIPIPPGHYYYSFEKVSNRKTLDIASVNSALLTRIGNNNKIEALNISAGGVAPIPLIAKNLEAFKGKIINESTIEKIAYNVVKQVVPIDDIRGSARYKRLLLKELIAFHFKKFCKIY